MPLATKDQIVATSGILSGTEPEVYVRRPPSKRTSKLKKAYRQKSTRVAAEGVSPRSLCWTMYTDDAQVERFALVHRQEYIHQSNYAKRAQARYPAGDQRREGAVNPSLLASIAEVANASANLIRILLHLSRRRRSNPTRKDLHFLYLRASKLDHTHWSCRPRFDLI